MQKSEVPVKFRTSRGYLEFNYDTSRMKWWNIYKYYLPFTGWKTKWMFRSAPEHNRDYNDPKHFYTIIDKNLINYIIENCKTMGEFTTYTNELQMKEEHKFLYGKYPDEKL